MNYLGDGNTTGEDYSQALQTLNIAVNGLVNKDLQHDAKDLVQDQSLTDLDTRADDLRTDVTQLQGTSDTLVATSATHTTQLSSLESRQDADDVLNSTQDGQIAANILAIAQNVTDVAQNASDIATLEPRVDSAELTLVDHGNRITSAEAVIINHTNELGLHESRLDLVEPRVTATENTLGLHGTRLDDAEATIVADGVRITDNEDAILALQVFQGANSTLDTQQNTRLDALENDGTAAAASTSATTANDRLNLLEPRVTAVETTNVAQNLSISALENTRVTLATYNADLTSTTASVGAIDTRLTAAETQVNANTTATNSATTRLDTAESQQNANTTTLATHTTQISTLLNDLGDIDVSGLTAATTSNATRLTVAETTLPTLATKAEVALKADSSHTHGAEFADIISNTTASNNNTSAIATLNAQIPTLATKAEVAGKADTGHTHPSEFAAVSANSSAITANTTAITTINAQVPSLATTVQLAGKADISHTHASEFAAVSANSSAISDLQVAVGAIPAAANLAPVQADIASLQAQQGVNSAAIGNLQTSVAAITVPIAVDLTPLQTSVTALEVSQAVTDGTVTALQTSLTNLSTTVSTLPTSTTTIDLTPLEDVVDDLKTGQAVNTAKIGTIEAQIPGIQATSVSNSIALGVVETTVQQHTAQLAAIPAPVPDLSTTVNDHTSQLSTHTSQIADGVTARSVLENRISGNETALQTLSTTTGSLSGTQLLQDTAIAALQATSDDLIQTTAVNTGSITQLSATVQGLQAAAPIPGPAGRDGLSITGPIGPIGPVGLPGQPGADGADGNAGTNIGSLAFYGMAVNVSDNDTSYFSFAGDQANPSIDGISLPYAAFLHSLRFRFNHDSPFSVNTGQVATFELGTISKGLMTGAGFTQITESVIVLDEALNGTYPEADVIFTPSAISLDSDRVLVARITAQNIAPNAAEYTCMITLVSTVFQTVVTGPVGPRGEIGPQGEIGPRGEIGQSIVGPPGPPTDVTQIENDIQALQISDASQNTQITTETAARVALTTVVSSNSAAITANSTTAATLNGTVTTLSTQVQDLEDDVDALQIAGSATGASVTTITSSLNSHIADASIHFPINDVTPSTGAVYSSSKVDALIASVPTGGGGGATINDSSNNLTDTWSSSKITTELGTRDSRLTALEGIDHTHLTVTTNAASTTQPYSAAKTEERLTAISVGGGGYDDTVLSGRVSDLEDDVSTLQGFEHNVLDDAQTTASTLWSSTKINAEIIAAAGGGGPSTTTDLPEGTNLYYTEARVSANTDVAANTAHVSTANIHNVLDDGLTSASTLWSSTKINAEIVAAAGSGGPSTTTDLPEGTNLYYTEARVSANTDVAANTAHASTANIHNVLDDGQTTATTLWSSSKTSSEINQFNDLDKVWRYDAAENRMSFPSNAMTSVTTETDSICIGHLAGANLKDGYCNILQGTRAGELIGTTGAAIDNRTNLIMGYLCGSLITQSFGNFILGCASFRQQTGALSNQNVTIGEAVLQSTNNVANGTSRNVAIGGRCLRSPTECNDSIAIGYYCGHDGSSSATGYSLLNSILVGAESLNNLNNYTLTDSVLIGNNTTINAATPTITNSIGLGQGVELNASNECVVGNASIARIRPMSNNVCNLGSTTNRYANVYTGAIDATGTINTSGSVTSANALNNGTYPTTDGVGSIGLVNQRWANVFTNLLTVAGKTIDHVTAYGLCRHGGTINDTPYSYTDSGPAALNLFTHNTNELHNMTSNTTSLIAGVTGYYKVTFSAAVRNTSNTDGCNFSLAKNSVATLSFFHCGFSGMPVNSISSVSTQGVFQLNAGDFVQVGVRCDTGGTNLLFNSAVLTATRLPKNE